MHLLPHVIAIIRLSVRLWHLWYDLLRDLYVRILLLLLLELFVIIANYDYIGFVGGCGHLILAHRFISLSLIPFVQTLWWLCLWLHDLGLKFLDLRFFFQIYIVLTVILLSVGFVHYIYIHSLWQFAEYIIILLEHIFIFVILFINFTNLLRWGFYIFNNCLILYSWFTEVFSRYGFWFSLLKSWMWRRFSWFRFDDISLFHKTFFFRMIIMINFLRI